MSEAHWYVVHTYSGYENKVKVDIEKTIENRNLQDQILEVSVPMLPVVELKNGGEKKADKKMFPGYVLINMVMNDDTWYVVRNTRGVTGFVGPGSKPVPLTEEEMADFTRKYIQAVNGRFDVSGIEERLNIFIPITCLRGITWCAMAWVEYQEPGRLIRNEETFKKMEDYLNRDFLDMIEERYYK